MPVHSQQEHGIIPRGPAASFAPLGDAELEVQLQVALGLRKGLNLHRSQQWTPHALEVAVLM